MCVCVCVCVCVFYNIVFIYILRIGLEVSSRALCSFERPKYGRARARPSTSFSLTPSLLLLGLFSLQLSPGPRPPPPPGASAFQYRKNLISVQSLHWGRFIEHFQNAYGSTPALLFYCGEHGVTARNGKKRRWEDRNFKEICQPLCIGSTWVEHYIETVGGSVKLFPALQELGT